jgi:hypothetical protein
VVEEEPDRLDLHLRQQLAVGCLLYQHHD